jgi:pre-rRNA-processing protein TSR1
MMVEEVTWSRGKGAASENNATTDVVLTGVIRGKALKADRLVHVGDWGDFQVEKIVARPLQFPMKNNEGTNAMDTELTDSMLDQPTEFRDELDELAPEQTVMDDATEYAMSVAPSERKGVLVDDHYYFSDEEKDHVTQKPKRLPKGTSSYQAAWFLDNDSDSGSDMEDVDEEMGGVEDETKSSFDPADGFANGELDVAPEPTEAGPSEYPQSEMFLDPSPEDEQEQIAAYRSRRRTEAEEDKEFPDEIELHPHVLARERLQRYRGLKSLKTSPWLTEEDRIHEPEDWKRLLEIADYKRAMSTVLKDTLVGGVKPGTRVNVHLYNVPLHVQDHYDPKHPLLLTSLLKHEHKHSSLNYSITLNTDYSTAIKSKTELLVQCGPRRMIINPLFSQAGNTPNNVHKFERFLHPGRNAIASFQGPVTWGNVPVLYFKRIDSKPARTQPYELIGTGTSLTPSLSRVIAKRVVLTGHPYKMHKRVVTVRYMFFNKEDVQWFKALQMFTKRGRSGWIKESLGMHGYFKATFDGKINPMDAVAVSLYKRVWPRKARDWDPLHDGEVAVNKADNMETDAVTAIS